MCRTWNCFSRIWQGVPSWKPLHWEAQHLNRFDNERCCSSKTLISLEMVFVLTWPTIGETCRAWIWLKWYFSFGNDVCWILWKSQGKCLIIRFRDEKGRKSCVPLYPRVTNLPKRGFNFRISDWKWQWTFRRKSTTCFEESERNEALSQRTVCSHRYKQLCHSGVISQVFWVVKRAYPDLHLKIHISKPNILNCAELIDQ